jgi:2'-phosphotransferase
MSQDQSSVLADVAPLSVSGTSNPDNHDSLKPSRKLRPDKGKGKEKEKSGSSNQPKRTGNQLRLQVRDSPEVRISKTLSWLLRHGAQDAGLKMRTDGYVKVDDLVRRFLPPPC